MRLFKRIVFSVIPLLVLLAAAEAATRVKYFFLHNHNWNYITLPYKVQEAQEINHSLYLAPTAHPNAPSAGQMNFKWLRPCQDREVFSAHYQKPMPYTWDDNCFRGDPVARTKPAGEIRIFVMGGSTVEDAQPDADMWTAHLKQTLADPRVRVVNAGQRGQASEGVDKIFDRKIRLFAPDVVLYYEAWNEQVEFLQWRQADSKIEALSGKLHGALYYRSAFYTYLVEKYAFMRTPAVPTGKGDRAVGLGQMGVRFWKIDVSRLQRNLETLARTVTGSGARFVFVTQVIKFPRHWKGVDTSDANAVDALLERLQRDPAYAYDTYEISALNQRLAVARSMEVCRALHVPVIDILDDVEALGESGREQLFIDLGHLTWQGDEMVGRLIGEKLKKSMTI